MLRQLIKPSATIKNTSCRHGYVPIRAYSSRPADEEDLLHRSPLPTDHFQVSLPRLKVPKLTDSMRRYAASQSALLSDEAMAAHQRLIDDFAEGQGPKLQASLEAFAKKNSHTSYITDFWFDMYLTDRRPIPLTHTPFISFTRYENPAYNAPDLKTTNLIYTSIRFFRALRQGCLAPEVYHLNPAKSQTDTYRRAVSWSPKSVATYVSYLFKAFPLDMSQFGNLFASTRLPRPTKDELRVWPESKHVMVMRRGHFYTFDVLDSAGRALSPLQILANVRQILNDPREEAKHPLGALTTTDRDTWVQLRERLLELGNSELLEQIDSALFVICLDDADLMAEPLKQIRSFLYGLTHNRWFDKCFSLIVESSGEAAINFEHSWGDGVAVMRYLTELYKDSKDSPVVHPDTTISNSVEPKIRLLDFKLDDGMRNAISKACSEYEKRTNTLDLNYRRIENAFNKSDVKRTKLSPDSVMQLSFQMTYYRMHGKPAPTYESCSTSVFKHGRTETLRSGTPETLAFCKLLHSGSAGPDELLAAMRKCSEKHNLLTKEAAMGQGWDRHLFGLRKMAEAELGSSDRVPLFADPAFAWINHIILSTSTLSSEAANIGGFGAVTPDGYGIGYGITDEGLGCIVSAYPEVGGTSIPDFMNAFVESTKALKAVMDGRAPDK